MADFSKTVVVRANNDGVLVIFPMGQDGLVEVFASRLGLMFQFKPDSIYFDEKVFQAKLSHPLVTLTT